VCVYTHTQKEKRGTRERESRKGERGGDGVGGGRKKERPEGNSSSDRPCWVDGAACEWALWREGRRGRRGGREGRREGRREGEKEGKGERGKS
jgi:hypothetical protein